jgi:hypothetical protein
MLKLQRLEKKELQVNRNRVTAQLSRDKKKIGDEFVRELIVRGQNKLRMYEKLLQQ